MMSVIQRGKLLFLIICLFLIPHSVRAQAFDTYLVQTLDRLATRTLAAYNANDYTGFKHYFAKKSEPFTQPDHFQAEFVSLHKKNLGSALRKQLLLADSSLDHHFPELVYQAAFEKHSPVIITVNFTNQNDNYRITRIRFDRVYEDGKHL